MAEIALYQQCTHVWIHYTQYRDHYQSLQCYHPIVTAHLTRNITIGVPAQIATLRKSLNGDVMQISEQKCKQILFYGLSLSIPQLTGISMDEFSQISQS